MSEKRVHHRIKCELEYYKAVVEGRKKFEIRRNDRDYQVGDFVSLVCVKDGMPLGETYGPLEIDYILFGGNFGLMSDHVIFSWKDEIQEVGELISKYEMYKDSSQRIMGRTKDNRTYQQHKTITKIYYRFIKDLEGIKSKGKTIVIRPPSPPVSRISEKHSKWVTNFLLFVCMCGIAMAMYFITQII